VSDAECLSPLRFEPILKEKIWGGASIGNVLNKAVPPHAAIGESWELSGVAGSESISTTKPFAGKNLAEICAAHRNSVVGPIPRYKGFPLLYKFLDSHAKLSVQVHPDDAQAAAHGGGNFGKTECWYIISAEPGAQLVCGFKKGVGRDDIKNAAASKNIVGLLNFIDVYAGDVVFVPGRTVHAVLGGVLFYEVQETSDTTFRLYDWDRVDNNGKPRQLHVMESLEIIDTTWHEYHKIPPVVSASTEAYTHLFRAACRHFVLEEYRFSSAAEVPLAAKRSFRVLTVCNGNVVLLYGGASCGVHKGETVLIPACLSSVQVAGEAGSQFFLSSVPDLISEVVAPLREKGVSQDAIVHLGGNPASSDLAILV
jgi:mannose-6-phosphate isomerase